MVTTAVYGLLINSDIWVTSGLVLINSFTSSIQVILPMSLHNCIFFFLQDWGSNPVPGTCQEGTLALSHIPNFPPIFYQSRQWGADLVLCWVFHENSFIFLLFLVRGIEPMLGKQSITELYLHLSSGYFFIPIFFVSSKI